MAQWTPKAELYDFGRPFPGRYVVRLFDAFCGIRGQSGLRVFEPGCGTGRILLPVAGRYDTWSFSGMDSSPAALAILRGRSQGRMANVKVFEGTLPNDLPLGPFDLILHSSVLHAVPEWQQTMSLLSERLTADGVFCLVGDYGDIYDAALGRNVRPEIDRGLKLFWDHYLSLRNRFGAPDPETSQRGCRWDLESTDLAGWLLQNGFREIKREEVRWDESFSSRALMTIIEERCYSSMFTVDEEVYDAIVEQMRTDLPSLEAGQVCSKHCAVARFFRR